MKKNILAAQSGGPSSAINATLAGIVELGLETAQVGQIFGAVHGIQGVLEDHIVEIGTKLAAPAALSLLAHTPGSALGSCRYRLKEIEQEQEYEKILQVCEKHEIDCFVYIGGNDSMDTVWKMSEYCKKKGSKLTVVGAPKTIDNDLWGTDHSPGYGSAAKYVASTFAEIGRDCNVYDVPAVTIVEVMGRDAGWLTAASALARQNGGSAPDLIYLCERPFSQAQLILDIKEVLKTKNTVVIAVSEGIKTVEGQYISAAGQNRSTDAFGHISISSGAANVLQEIVKSEIGCKVRSLEFSLMQRCAAHIASDTDLTESKWLGAAALNCALSGISGKMPVLHRISNEPYQCEIQYMDICDIANKVKEFPIEWINKNGNDVLQEFVTYAKPLIQGEVVLPWRNGIPLHWSISK